METIDPRILLARIARVLDDLGIQYMVTGGVAVFIWGRPRFTADIDLVIELVSPKVDALAGALLRIDDAGYIDRAVMINALQRHGEFNFIAPSTGLKVDFWVMSDSEVARRELSRRHTKTVLGQKISVISPEDLILSKLRWYKKGGGERHLEDIKSVMSISRAELDLKYLQDQAREQSLNDYLKNLDFTI